MAHEPIDTTEDVPVDETVPTTTVPETGDIGGVVNLSSEGLGAAAERVLRYAAIGTPWFMSPGRAVLDPLWRFFTANPLLTPPSDQRPTVGSPDPAYAPVEAPDVGVIKDQADDDAVLKHLYFDGISEEAAFIKLVNWLAGTGTNMVVQSPGGLGYSLQGTLASGGMDDLEVRSLASPEGKEYVRNYLMTNWRNIPDLLESVAQQVRAGYGDYLAAVGDDGKVSNFYRDRATDTVDPQFVTDVLQEFGGTSFGLDAPALGQVGETFGFSNVDQQPIGDIIFGALDEAVDEMMFRVIEPNQSIFIGPNGLPTAEGGQERFGFITTFDGTPFGSVESFGDLFSGGKIGPLEMTTQLQKADRDVIEKFQREFVALGLMDQPAAWGKLTVDPRTGTMPTIEAAVGWQVSLTQEALNMVDRRTGTLAPDGTPWIDKVMDNFVANRMAGDDTLATHERNLKAQVVNEAGSRIQQYLTNTGRYLPEGAQLQLQSGLQDIIGDMSKEQQEAAFGQGGSPWERSLAENALKQFYGVDDWGSMLTFGGTDRDEDFFNYAARVGAVSNRERDMLRLGSVDRKGYRRHWRGNEDDLLEVQKDVAVAGLLKFISEGMSGSLADATAQDVARGLTSYMYTIGSRQRRDKNYSQRSIAQFSQFALDNATAGNNDLVDTLVQQGAEQYGQGVGGYRYKNLVSALNSVSRGAGKLGVRNV